VHREGREREGSSTVQAYIPMNSCASRSCALHWYPCCIRDRRCAPDGGCEWSVCGLVCEVECVWLSVLCKSVWRVYVVCSRVCSVCVCVCLVLSARELSV
jgi:hypothetical protein